MIRWIYLPQHAVVLLLAGLATDAPLLAYGGDEAAAASERWASEIDHLTAGDLTNPPPRGGIVFVGSSSIRKWTSLEKDFAGLNVIQRGFGGSELTDSVYFADRIVLPYQPRIVVLYAGDNDIAHGTSPPKVAADFDEFHALMHTRLPSARIVYVSIKPSPARSAFHKQFREANTLVASACAKDPLCTFVDVWKLMLDEQGQPRADLFVEDQLHMNAAGYDIWRKAIQPYLESEHHGDSAERKDR